MRQTATMQMLFFIITGFYSATHHYSRRVFFLLKGVPAVYLFLLLFDDNKTKMTRKPGKKQKENSVWCTGEGKRWKGNVREGSRENKTGTVLGLSLEVKWPLWVRLALQRCCHITFYRVFVVIQSPNLGKKNSWEVYLI